MDAGYIHVQQSHAGQFTHDGGNATGAMHVLHMDVHARGRNLAQVRHPVGQAVDVRHGEMDLPFMGGGQQVQHGIG